MSGRRIWAVVAKEFRHLRRDPRIVGAALLLPIVQLLLFGYAISFDVRNVPTVVIDQDKTAASRAYVAAYASSDFFDVRGEAGDLGAVDRLFDAGRARIVVVVPAGFADALARDERPQVAVLIDGSEPNAARIGSAYATALNRSYGQRLAVSWATRQGVDPSMMTGLEPRLRTWYNPERRSSIFLVPGLLVVILMIVTVQQTAVTLVRERDLGTAEQLAVSPLRPAELLVGKLLPWTVLAFIDLAVVAVLGRVVFGVPVTGSIGFFVLAAVVFVFSALGLGLIVSALAPTMESANIVALMLAFLPSFLLSGFAFPLDSVPRVLQWVSYAFPGRYMVDISRGVFLKGSGAAELWPQLAQLTGYAVVVLVIANLAYRRRRS